MKLQDIFTKKPNILVVGDIMLDVFIRGNALRISPEAPIPVVSHVKTSNQLGGAANVACNLVKWNAEVEMFGAFGNDEKGAEILKLTKSQNIRLGEDCGGGGRATITKVRVIAGPQHVCRVDFEDSPQAYAPSETQIAQVISAIDRADAVVVSDYAKGFITEELMRQVVEKCNRTGKVLCVDPKPRNKISYKNPYLLKPNKKEALELAGLSVDAIFKYPTEEVCGRIFEKYSPKYLVITLGEDGMLLADKSGIKKVLPSRVLSVFDVSGAGDTVVSMLAFALACGMDIEDAMAAASTAAGIVVGKAGTAQAEISEILDYGKESTFGK